MNKKLPSMLIMLTMIFSIASTIAIGETEDIKPIKIENPDCGCPSIPITWDCSLWSTDDNQVNLGVASWSLLNGSAMVSAYKNIGCDLCNCYDKPYNCNCHPCCCCVCDDNDEICACEDYNCSEILEDGVLTHRGTRGLGVGSQEDDEIDSINEKEFIIITFDSPQQFVSFEVRSLFIEKFNGLDVVEEGDVDLLLRNEVVHHFHFMASEVIGSGNGAVVVSDPDLGSSNLVFNQIIFYVGLNVKYSAFSDFSVAKLHTTTSTISFVQPLEGVDCDNEPDNLPPVVSDIPDQTVFVGDAFAMICLDDFVSDPDDNDGEIVWNFSGNSVLNVTILGTGAGDPPSNVRFAQITAPEGWTGTETITFTATDPDGLFDFDEAKFTVLKEHNPYDPDGDYDGDGVINRDEDLNNDGNPDNDDTDEDGVPDYLDGDDDGDGIPTLEEITDGNEFGQDVDEDNVPNYLDTDSDGDGSSDHDEGTGDNDGDGIPNYLDANDEDGPLGDLDGDGIPNNVDTDDDGDGYLDEDEIACGSDPMDPESVPDDNDGDFIPDCVDEDDDNDTVPDETEDHNNDGNNTNDDNDGDGIPDYQDPDDDNDGIPTQDEDPNEDGDPTNDDTDGDGIPDYLDDEDNSNNNNNNNNNNGHSNSLKENEDDDDEEPPVVVEPPNSVPTKPVVEGPDEGEVDEVLEFIITPKDEDNDALRIIIQWGDGEVFISDFIPSGEALVVNHSFNSSGDFTITVKSEDGETVSGDTKLYIKINEKEEPIDDTVIDTGGEENIFWAVTGILSAFLFMAPVGLMFRRKFYE